MKTGLIPDRDRNRTIGYCLTFICLGAVIALQGPAVPSLAENTGVGLSTIGLTISLRSLGYLLGSLFIGRLYDRLPGHYVIIGALGLTFVMLLTIPVTVQFVVLLVLMFLLGVSMGGTDVGGNTLTAWIYGRKSGPYISALFFFAGVGGLISPLIAGWVLGNGIDLRIAYWIAALFVLPPIIWLSLVKSPARRKQTDEDSKKVNWGMLAIFGLIFFLIIGVEASFGGWIYTYFLLDVQDNIQKAALVSSIFWMSLTFGRLLNIPLVGNVRPSRVAGIGMVGAFIGIFIILLSNGSQPGVFVGTAIMGVFIAAVAPTVVAMTERHLHVTGKMMGIIWSFGSAGAILVPWLVGNGIEKIGPASMLVIFLVCLGLGFLTLVYLIRITSRNSPTQVDPLESA